MDCGPFIESSGEHYGLLRHVCEQLQPTGTAIEFGVGKGNSTWILAQHLPTIGFDSFQGLPEDWRDGFPAGTFRSWPPAIPNVRLVIGLFSDTLQGFPFTNIDQIGLVHIDCDLYSSTSMALQHIGPHLQPGCYVIFDEWHGYDGAEFHEQRAWHEYTKQAHIHYEPIAHSFQQACFRITDTKGSVT